MALPPDEVHLWLADAAVNRSPARVREILASMSAEERERYDRYRHPDRAREFLLTRAIVRETLSRYVPRAPADWTFAFNEHGAPRVSPEALAPGLRFNLSNTQGLVACAVALDREIGVDVEWIHRRGRPLEVADRYFATQELAELHALPDHLRLERFFDLWTLKESYIKAVGKGLAIPLGKFAFRFENGIRLWVDPSLGDDGDGWELHTLSPTRDHRAAVAVRRTDQPCRLIVRWCEPFRNP